MAVREAILGKKVGMTRLFDDSGEVIPATVIEAGPCYVTQVKTIRRDGYAAIQLGFAEARRLNRPQKGHLRDLPELRYLRELRTDDAEEYQVGQVLDVGRFSVGDQVDVIGTSKGKGFAGVMKRHGFRGGPRTHGQSDRERAPGSIGSGTTPGRTYKGMRMPGRMGGERVTAQSLEVVLVDPERNLLAVRGSVPGSKNSLIMIKKAVKTTVRRGQDIVIGS
jgi:large subunit ribosomal protein L3